MASRPTLSDLLDPTYTYKSALTGDRGIEVPSWFMSGGQNVNDFIESVPKGFSNILIPGSIPVIPTGYRANYDLGDTPLGSSKGTTVGQAVSDVLSSLSGGGSSRAPRTPQAAGATGPYGITAAPQTSVSLDALERNLQAKLDMLEAARNAAIRKSGSGAAAQYNDAIARVEAEMAQVQEAKRQTNELYQGVSQGSGNLFDQALANANYGPQAVAHQQQLATNLAAVRAHDFDSVFQDTNHILTNIGVDQGTADSVSSKIKDIQGEIMASDQLQEGFREKIAQLSGTLAAAAVKYAKATSLADLERKRVTAQLGLDKQLQDLVSQKEDLIKARARAVSAARAATAAQYNGNVPTSADEYGQWHMYEFLQESNVDPGQQSTIYNAAHFLSGPFQLDDGTQVLSGIDPTNKHSYGLLERAIQEMVAQGSLAWTPEQIKTYTPIVWTSMQIYRDATTKYQTDIVGGDPLQFEPYTMDRTAAEYAHAQVAGLDPKDIIDYATSAAANTGWTNQNTSPVPRGFDRS